MTKILTICLLLLMAQSPEDQRKERLQELERGHVLAWARHKTGVDQDDEFKSVAVIPGSGGEDEVYVVVKRTINGSTVKSIEQFQPVDFGDQDDAWFVDCGPSGDTIGTGWIPATSSQATTGIGTWREWICGRGATGFEAWTYEYVYMEGVESPPYNVTYHVHQDIYGYIYTGSGKDGSGDVKPYKFNSDLSLISNWPTYNTWENGAQYNVFSVRPTNDAQFVYVISSSGVTGNNSHITKLTANTGAFVWRINGQFKTFDVGVLANGNVILPNAIWSPVGYYRPRILSATDGSAVLTYMSQNSLSAHYRVLVVEKDDVNMWYTVGIAKSGVSGYGIAQGWSTTSDTGWDFDPFSSTGTARGIVYKNGSVYVVTDRAAYNGGTASIFKLNATTGAVQAYYDTGFTPQDIAINYLDQFVVVTNAGSPMWYIYDDDFNELANYNRNLVSTWRIEQIPDALLYGGETISEAGPGDSNSYYGLDHLIATEVCVYADGRPIGNFTVDANGVLDLGTSYDTVVPGINYYSVYESYLLAPKNTMIKDAVIDFYETLGCHVGVDQTYSADWKFSYDNFATRADMFSGYKYAPWLRGTTFDPRVYLWEWEPIPTTVRGIYLQMEVE